MAWIESHQALGHHPKTIALAGGLKCSLPTAVGYLQYLWWWALDYAQDGCVHPASRQSLARYCLWRGDPARFWSALIDAGFVDAPIPFDSGGVAYIHDWSDYAGKLQSQRELRRAANREAQRKRRERLSAVTPDDVTSDADDSQHSTGPTNQPDQPLSTAGRQRARTHEVTASPKLLAEHLMRIAQEQASHAKPRQPSENSSQDEETNADG